LIIGIDNFQQLPGSAGEMEKSVILEPDDAVGCGFFPHFPHKFPAFPQCGFLVAFLFSTDYQ
jgi:hypothetical protein